jgi:uncharacterized protein
MELKGEYEIAAPRQRVWEALNNPEVLRACIPGCDSLEKTADNAFEAKVTAKVGPVKAKFGGNVTLENMNPPESYSIVGEGKGGAAGFAKGGADVHLAEKGPDLTVLSYTVTANVGGKLAQLGTRLIQGTSKRMADDFFARFREQVEGPPSEVTAAAGVEAPVPETPESVPAATAEVLSEPPARPAEGEAVPPPTPTAPIPTPTAPQPPISSKPLGSEEVVGSEETGPGVDQGATPERPAPAETGSEVRPEPEVHRPAARERERQRVEPPPTPKTMSPLVWIVGLVVLILLLIWVVT